MALLKGDSAGAGEKSDVEGSLGTTVVTNPETTDLSGKDYLDDMGEEDPIEETLSQNILNKVIMLEGYYGGVKEVGADRKMVAWLLSNKSKYDSFRDYFQSFLDIFGGDEDSKPLKDLARRYWGVGMEKIGGFRGVN